MASSAAPAYHACIQTLYRVCGDATQSRKTKRLGAGPLICEDLFNLFHHASRGLRAPQRCVDGCITNLRRMLACRGQGGHGANASWQAGERAGFLWLPSCWGGRGGDGRKAVSVRFVFLIRTGAAPRSGHARTLAIHSLCRGVAIVCVQGHNPLSRFFFYFYVVLPGPSTVTSSAGRAFPCQDSAPSVHTPLLLSRATPGVQTHLGPCPAAYARCLCWMGW